MEHAPQPKSNEDIPEEYLEISEEEAALIAELEGRDQPSNPLTQPSTRRPGTTPSEQLGSVTVYGSQGMRGTQVTLFRLKPRPVELRAVIVERGGGRRGDGTCSALFPQVPPGMYNVHHALHHCQLTVFEGEAAEVDWRDRGQVERG